MTPYFEDIESGIVIYHGDCREVLPGLEGVDLVLTDPPYGIGFDYGDQSDHIEGYFERVIQPIKAIESKAFAVFQSEKTNRNWPEWFGDFNLICICKKWTQLNTNFLPKAVDFVLWWGNENTDPSGWQPNNARNWFVSNNQVVRTGLEKLHPCPRPLDSMMYLISCLARLEALILDPYLGSGTTLVAAKKLHRKAAGIEIEERYCEIAARRVMATPRPLFTEPAPEPVQMDAFL